MRSKRSRRRGSWSTVLNESGLIAALQEDGSVEAEGRLKNLEELVNAVRRMVRCAF